MENQASPAPSKQGTGSKGPRAGASGASRSQRRFDGRPVYAALDLGTHNCRMLAAVSARGGFRVINSFSRIVSLGSGLAETGQLNAPSMDRTLEALTICAEKMERLGVTRARSVATAACRSAANGEQFSTRVREQTGIKLEIIEAQEEARLTVEGCAPLLHGGAPCAIMFDIGGGSVEVSWVAVHDQSSPRVHGMISIDLGVVTLSDQYGTGLLPSEQYAAIVDRVATALAPFEAQHHIRREIESGTVQMLGTSGTMTTLGALSLGLDHYDRSKVDGMKIKRSIIEDMCRNLAPQDLETRAAHPCIGNERAGLVVVGCAILEGIYRVWPVNTVTIADRGIREGILLELIAGDRLAAMRAR